MKKKGKSIQEQGITLIALIITIVVLLILAVVAINSIKEDGIISKAEQAANKYNESVNNEADRLDEYLELLNRYNGGNGGGEDPVVYQTVSDAKTKASVYQENKTLQDDFGNLVKLPAGFKIASDSATVVTGGVVIEDVSAKDATSKGNQFVWVPTGNIKTSATDTVGTTIELNRYDFADGTNDKDAEGNVLTRGTPIAKGTTAIDTYYEELATSTYGNATALNLTNFLNSAKPVTEGGNGGYYIGRYEAGDAIATASNTARASTSGASTPGTLVCKKDQIVYNYIYQPDASTACRNMYTGNSNFTSDLVNSYAWDTAIVFIQTFGVDKETVTDPLKSVKNYSYLNKSTKYGVAGENGDEYCNINDMSGNAYEWTTETYSYANNPCVSRGGCYFTYFSSASFCASNRGNGSTTSSSDNISFRPLLYVGL